MVYRTSETKVVEKLVKPSDIYSKDAEQNIPITLAKEGVKIVAFRIAKDRDRYVNGTDGQGTSYASSYAPTQPRFIVERIPAVPAFPEWE